MAHNISLQILDEYAKVITAKQANMLYESKCKKKFKKQLNEGMEYQNNDNFKVYLDLFTLDEANSSVEKALARYVNKYKLQYNVIKEGLYLYTPYEENYEGLLENLYNDGFDVEALKENVSSQSGRVFLEKLSAGMI